MVRCQFKKESRRWDSPPAASRFSDTIPYRRSAIPAERFLFHRKVRRTFLWNKKRIWALAQILLLVDISFYLSL